MRGECSKSIHDIERHYITSGAFGHTISSQCLEIGFSTHTKLLLQVYIVYLFSNSWLPSSPNLNHISKVKFHMEQHKNKVISGFIEERKQEPAHIIFIFAERHLNRHTLLEHLNQSTSQNTSDPSEH